MSNLLKTFDSLKFEPKVAREINGGHQLIFKFDNEYGASVVKHDFSYGIELAVIKYEGDGDYDWEIDYKTPITDDVVGHLNIDTLNETLKLIKELPIEVELIEE